MFQIKCIIIILKVHPFFILCTRIARFIDDIECMSMNVCDPPTLKAPFICSLHNYWDLILMPFLFSVLFNAVSVNLKLLLKKNKYLFLLSYASLMVSFWLNVDSLSVPNLAYLYLHPFSCYVLLSFWINVYFPPCALFLHRLNHSSRLRSQLVSSLWFCSYMLSEKPPPSLAVEEGLSAKWSGWDHRYIHVHARKRAFTVGAPYYL